MVGSGLSGRQVLLPAFLLCLWCSALKPWAGLSASAQATGGSGGKKKIYLGWISNEPEGDTGTPVVNETDDSNDTVTLPPERRLMLSEILQSDISLETRWTNTFFAAIDIVNEAGILPDEYILHPIVENNPGTYSVRSRVGLGSGYIHANHR